MSDPNATPAPLTTPTPEEMAERLEAIRDGDYERHAELSATRYLHPSMMIRIDCGHAAKALRELDATRASLAECEAELAEAEARVAALTQCLHDSIPFIGYGACVDDIKDRAMALVDYPNAALSPSRDAKG